MKNHKSLAPFFNNKGKRYPRSFKEEVVKSILSGKFPSKEAARRYYGIGGGSTILEWLEEYICIEDISKNLETMKEKQKDQNLEEELEKQAKQIRELEELLRREKLKNELNKAFIEIAEEEYGINLRKKYGAKQLEKSKRSAGKR
jgi:transposase-like protein